MIDELKALVKGQKTWRHPDGTWKGETLVFPNDRSGHYASGTRPGCPALLPGRSLPWPPGRLDPGHFRTHQMGVGDFVNGRDRHRGESVQGSRSERGRRGEQKRSYGRDAGQEGEGCGGESYGTAGEEKALGLGERKCARS